MSKRRLVALFDRRVARRLIIVPIVVVLAIIAVVASPVLLPLAFAVDVIKRAPRRPRTRLVLLVLGGLVIEVLSIVTSFVLWVRSGFGLAGQTRARWHLNRRFMGTYTNAMLTLITRVLGVRVEWRDNADLSHGPVILLARHTSFFDALIPATLLSHRNKLLAHHVVANGLRYAPSIDIVGHRFPNRFVKRTPGEGSNELPHIAEIGALLDARSAAIIFPEGTFRNHERFERQVRRLRRREPELAARAEHLLHVLPPRPPGVEALLAGASDADIVICANTGFEPFGSIKQIIDAPYGDRPIIIETWRLDRAQVPTAADEFHRWLFDQYVVIDEWVQRQQPDAADTKGP